MLHLRTVTLPRYYVGRLSKQKARDVGCYTNSPKDGPPASEPEESHVHLAAEVDEAALIQHVDTSLSLDPKEIEKLDVVGNEVNENKFFKNRGSEGDIKKETSARHSPATSLMFTAPVPQHFSWTMERLGINVPSVY